MPNNTEVINMGKHKDCKAGIYVRLSNEDARAGESVSIENQKLLLTKHVKEQGWELVEIYCDDGFSGTNQNRPALQRMLADVRQGLINVVLIKDLSRLGRNYLEVGNLAEVFLPQHGCELISLNEKLDDMMVFRNWFNEQHSKEASKKVKAVRKMCAQSGKFLGSYAPYGFMKSPDNKHKLVIDEQTAPTVRKIFELRAQGMGFRAIAVYLNEQNIIPPRDYYYQIRGGENPANVNHLWNENTLKVILRNEAYIGNTVQAKVGTVSYKNHKTARITSPGSAATARPVFLPGSSTVRIAVSKCGTRTSAARKRTAQSTDIPLSCAVTMPEAGKRLARRIPSARTRKGPTHGRS